MIDRTSYCQPIHDMIPIAGGIERGCGSCCGAGIEAKLDRILERMESADLRDSYDRLTREWDRRRKEKR